MIFLTISIKELLSLAIFDNVSLVAGNNGQNKYVNWVTILEVLDDIEQLEKGELLLTTAFDLLPNTDLIKTLIPKLAQKGLAGIAIQTGYYLEEIPKEMIEAGNKLDFPIIEIPKTTTFSDITKTVHKHIINKQFQKIQHSENLYRKLTDIAVNNEGLKPIAKAVNALTNGHIMIFDKNTNELCSTIVKNDKWEVEIDFILENIHHYKEEFEISNLRDITLPYENQFIYIAPIKSIHNVYGYIVCLKEGKLNEFEEIAIQHATTICALEFIKLSSLEEKDNKLRADFLELVLSGNFTDELTIYSKGEALGYKIGSYDTCVAAISIDNYKELSEPGIESKILKLILKSLRESGLQCLFKLLSGQYVMLITNRWTKRVDINELLFSISNKVFTKFSVTLSVGIGRYYEDFTQYKDSYKEAQESLFIIQSVWKGNKILHFNELGIYKILLPILQNSEEIDKFIQEVLGEVLNNEELLKTLKVYLNNMKINETADTLFIHRHTLKYRLNKIENITNRDLSNLKDRIELELALIIYQMIN